MVSFRRIVKKRDKIQILKDVIENYIVAYCSCRGSKCSFTPPKNTDNTHTHTHTYTHVQHAHAHTHAHTRGYVCSTRVILENLVKLPPKSSHGHCSSHTLETFAVDAIQ